MLVGDARVSTHDQTLALQQDALRQAGCERLFTDTASGATADRPGLDAALAYARPGDTLVVWKLDRLGRSLPHLLETLGRLQERGVGFRNLTEQLDTTAPYPPACRRAGSPRRKGGRSSAWRPSGSRPPPPA